MKILIQLHLLRLGQKNSLVSGNGPSEKLPAHIVECVSEYIYLISKNKQTSQKNKNKVRTQKSKSN